MYPFYSNLLHNSLKNQQETYTHKILRHIMYELGYIKVQYLVNSHLIYYLYINTEYMRAHTHTHTHTHTQTNKHTNTQKTQKNTQTNKHTHTHTRTHTRTHTHAHTHTTRPHHQHNHKHNCNYNYLYIRSTLQYRKRTGHFILLLSVRSIAINTALYLLGIGIWCPF